MRYNNPLLRTQAGPGISPTPPHPRPEGVRSASLQSPGGNGSAGTKASLETPPAAVRPPQPDGPPHPRPLEPLQAGTRPTSRPAGPGGFRSARGPTPPPRPDSSSHWGLRGSRVPEEAAAPSPARPPRGPTLTHPPAGRTPPAPSLRFPSVQLY